MERDDGVAGARRGADVLAEGLAQAGVARIFTLSGNQIMPVFDACLDVGIELVHVRHEAAAVHMADAWGRLTGTPGVAMVTGGPGHANAVSALFTALASESPMVLLSGHAPRARLGHGAFQEMAQADMAAPVCKRAWTAASSAGLGGDVRDALVLAERGRPGPVHLSLPFDLLEAKASPGAAPAGSDASHSGWEADLASAAAACFDGCAAARRPLVLGGPHLLRALGAAGLAELGEALGAPVVAGESPRGINDPALGAFAEVLAQADLIVMLGRPVDFTLGFGGAPAIAPDARFHLFDPESGTLARSRTAIGDESRVAQSVVADTLDVVAALRSAATARAAPAAGAWPQEVADAVAYRPAAWGDTRSPAGSGLHPLEVCRAVHAVVAASEDAVLVIDGGEFGQWAQATLAAKTRLINGPGGSIGSALPFALAARIARPGAPVIALLGDGTFGFHAAEFMTAVRYGLDFVAVVGNDACWNAEYQIQMREYGKDRLIGCELDATRYDRVVAAFGGHGEHVGRADELGPALARAAAAATPACINVDLARHAAPVVRRAVPQAAE